MSILNPTDDVKALTPELDKITAVLAQAIGNVLTPILPVIQHIFDGYSVTIKIDVSKKA